LTARTALEIAADVSATLRREFPELLVRDTGPDGDLDAGLLTLVRWLIERTATDERLARVGSTRICDQLLRDGFPRRALLRAIALLRTELGRSTALDPGAVNRVTTSLLDIVTRRLVPDAPSSSVWPGLVAIR
jgi:hypothetical protein